MFEWLNNIFSSASQSWENAVAELKTKAAEFSNMVSYLQSKRAVINKNPALQADYNGLMSSAVTIRERIQTITQKIDAAVRAGSELFGMDKAQTMGALPLLPVALITGGIALITKWLSEAYQLKAKIEHAEKMQAQGVDPVAIQNALAEKPGGIMTTNTAIGAALPAILALGVFAWLNRGKK